jgi:hypothetical protein
MPGDPIGDDRAAPAAEIERLRALVGPNEESYADLQAELEQSSAAVREAELANGRLRAEIVELRVDLRRARQDQYHVWKLVGRPGRLLRALRRSAEPG